MRKLRNILEDLASLLIMGLLSGSFFYILILRLLGEL
jgi:hypothetical protein